MKAINTLYKILALTGLVMMASCQIDEEFERYNPDTSSIGPGSITYTDLSVYPVAGIITTTEPVLDMGTSYGLVLGEIAAPEGSTFNVNNFSIDKVTGVITYDNSNADLSVGEYKVSVGITTINGVVIVNEALTITVLSVPVSLSVDNAEVSAGALEVGVMATVSYSDLSGEGLVTSVSYSLVSPPTGFAINAETGEITKSADALEGPNVLTVRAETNLGTVTVADMVTVTVGAPPVIEYFQQDGTTALTQVTLSPWTGYTTTAPTLTGMESSGGYTLILPENLDPSAISVAADGSITIPVDQNLAEGSYSIGVQVTNGSGISFDFPDQFTLVVELRWSELINEDFNDGYAGDINPQYPLYNSYPLNGTAQEWTKVVVTKSGVPDIEGFRKFNPADTDGCLTREVDVTGQKALRVSFGEVFGYNDDFVAKFARNFYFGEDITALATGTFNDAEWNVLLAPSDPRWPGTNTWGTRLPQFVEDVDIDLANVTSNTIYLNWRIFAFDPANVQNGQYIVDSVTISTAVIFTAEEQ